MDRDEAIRRMARGLDVPDELVESAASVGAWRIADDAVAYATPSVCAPVSPYYDWPWPVEVRRIYERGIISEAEFRTRLFGEPVGWPRRFVLFPWLDDVGQWYQWTRWSPSALRRRVRMWRLRRRY